MSDTHAAIRYQNTLHGFNPFARLALFTYTSMMNDHKFGAFIRERSGVASAQTDDYLGRPYVSINTKDKSKIPLVINAALAGMSWRTDSSVPAKSGLFYVRTYDHPELFKFDDRVVVDAGHIYVKQDDRTSTPGDAMIYARMSLPDGVTLQTRPKTVYKVGQVFSVEQSEMNIIEEYSNILKKSVELFTRYSPGTGRQDAIRSLSYEHCTPSVLFIDRLWKTEQGKEFSHVLRLMFPERASDPILNEPFEFATETSDALDWITKLEKDIEDPSVDFPFIYRETLLGSV